MDDQVLRYAARRDEDLLEQFGYKQELSRGMSAFGNFAMSFMAIGLFWALGANMQQGLGTAGAFGITVTWLIGGGLAYATAASLGEISSAIPTAGGLYHWSSVLGGRGWGWATAWINLISYVFSVGGTAVAFYLLFNQLILNGMLHIDTSHWGYAQQVLGVTLIVGGWAALNHFGVKTLAWCVMVGAYVTFAGAVALVVVMLCNLHLANLAHLFSFTNNTGDAGGGVVPHTGNLLLSFGYALLLPMWIVTSYDAAAHVSEETVDASRAVPRAMRNSVILSVVLGGVLLVLFYLAMNDPAAIAKKGGDGFALLFEQVRAPRLLKDAIVLSLTVSAYICGASALTGLSRAIYSFARDRGLPLVFSRVSARYATPVVGIWAGAFAGIAVTLYSSAFNALVAGTALFYQLAYGMAIGAAMFARNRHYGPYRLGVLSRPYGAVAIVGGIFIIWVGLQPPTDILIHYFIGFFVLMVLAWFGFERRRFPGPPVTSATLRAGGDAGQVHQVGEAMRESR
ncbi:amino acid permease [Burkholderia sp. A1]|uniref:amino acid permease n=1 Tax=Burkholderia sp. A1 TaxID=148446 RepID=UPI00046B01E0|nr:amino acid permease [Burkholderia sp. A1]